MNEFEDNIVIQAENVCKSFHDGEKDLQILRGFNFTVRSGESIAIIGRSGTGKSTFLNTLGLLDTPSSGKIIINGTDTTKLSDTQKTKIRGEEIGFVFQQYHLFGDLTALENVMIAGNFAKRNLGKKYALDLLDQVGLSDRLKHKPSKLSGGEQQRVAIARALFTDPAILLCDEPTGNLDPESGVEIMDILFKVVESKRAAMVLVTHDLQVSQNAHKSLKLLNGVLVDTVFDPPI